MLNESIRYGEDGALWCDGVSLAAVANATDTPVYVYSADRVKHNIARLKAAFGPLGASIHYSAKANANLALLRLIHAAGIGVDAVSAGEIFRAIQAGVDPKQIVFAGVGKTREELIYALSAGVGWFNVESRAELDLLHVLADEYKESGQAAGVALRLNPGIRANTHRHIATGHFGAKFGMPPDEVAALLEQRRNYPNLKISGLHVHIGSQLGDVQRTADAVRAALTLAAPYPDVRTLNVGGGFPVRYADSDEYPRLEQFAEAIQPLIEGWHLMIEPGRFIVADAGVMIVSVLYVKEQGGQRFVVTDGSMTELLRPALYDAVHPVVPLKCSLGEALESIVVGPVCESSDVLHRGARLPDLKAGDRLAVLGTGAYGLVMASNYNMRTRPPEVLVEGETWRVIRRRETWDDLLRLEEEDQA
jgi:diaminopimelate decarboxylase